ncbi:2198_t:CDS:2 [Entrophospora sp. SA101]|nr:6833_t:CDS:2 [Entrophospora sp. SA101]CAJ0748641.1 2198_t:CDS:2 [Entrophospora sp. SA101]CAJ0842641.1 2591_t:CDS:2 [Entrophospora sp. SA101]CAJ0923443.1 19147_t:CDS:2 [Entrophospora sp. SA101]CAJ0923444.1 19148_t:CDS:2 [Entrophospora sp. SA101]
MEFGAGPAMIPQEVLEKVQLELLNYNNTGIIVYARWWPHTIFCLVYNLLAAKNQNMSQTSVDEEEKEVFNSPLDYIITGSWSSKAFEEAKRLYNNINVVIDAKKFNGSYGSIPSKERWKFNGSKAAYVYYCDNETVNGVEFIMFLK